MHRCTPDKIYITFQLRKDYASDKLSGGGLPGRIRKSQNRDLPAWSMHCNSNGLEIKNIKFWGYFTMEYGCCEDIKLFAEPEVD